MSDTRNKETFIRVDRNYLVRGDSPVVLQNPYTICTRMHVFNEDDTGRDRLSAQRDLWGMDYRPSTLFEELNAAARHFYESESRIPLEDEIEALRMAGKHSLWLDNLLIGAGTPSKGVQDGINYVIDYTASSGCSGFFTNDKAKSPIIMSGWKSRYINDKRQWIIVPGKIFKLPDDVKSGTFQYDPKDVSPETGFIYKPWSMGHHFAWISDGAEIRGLRPVSISPDGDVNARWNLDDKEIFIAARLCQ